jgi:hypothetical protein
LPSPLWTSGARTASYIGNKHEIDLLGIREGNTGMAGLVNQIEEERQGNAKGPFRILLQRISAPRFERFVETRGVKR